MFTTEQKNKREMKTPMQELIEWLEKYGDNRLYGGRELTIHEIKNHAKAMLEKEKEVMVDFAYKCRNLMAGDEFAISHWYDKIFNTTEK